MRSRLYSLIILNIILVSCSKSNTPAPKQPSNTGSIGGKSYTTAVIGNQTWTTINYDGPAGIVGPNLAESIYGKFYTIAESQAITLPSGWRLPTQADFTALMTTQGSVSTNSDGKIALAATSSHLRSTSGDWFTSITGDNRSGFNAQPGGFGYVENNYFLYQKGTAYFLSSTPNPTHPGANIFLIIESSLTPGGVVADAYIYPKEYIINGSFTLRFVKDN